MRSKSRRQEFQCGLGGWLAVVLLGLLICRSKHSFRMPTSNRSRAYGRRRSRAQEMGEEHAVGFDGAAVLVSHRIRAYRDLAARLRSPSAKCTLAVASQARGEHPVSVALAGLALCCATHQCGVGCTSIRRDAEDGRAFSNQTHARPSLRMMSLRSPQRYR